MYDTRITTVRTEGKPEVREIARKYGMSTLSDHELMMMILGSGSKTSPVENLAQKVLETIRSTHNDTVQEQLYSIPGMGPGKAGLVCAALELGKRQGKKRSFLLEVRRIYFRFLNMQYCSLQKHFYVHR